MATKPRVARKAPRATPAPARDGDIRVGIGGWTYEPWRKTFYPAGTVQTRELDYASRKVSAIEINGTFYGLQKPQVFAKWHDATPDGFMFSVKAPRFIVQRTDLKSAGSAVERFIASGLVELKSKLGPILWQFSDTKRFDASEMEGFLALLPPTAGPLKLRHALQPRHASFLNSQFHEIARRHGAAVVYEDDAVHAGVADLTSNFVYARLRRSKASCATGYSPAALKQWSLRARTWAQGNEPSDLPRIATKSQAPAQTRDVFIFFINGAKERAPAAAQKLITLLQAS